MFYNECLSTFSLLTTANINEENIENTYFQQENLNFIFEDIINKIEIILNQEISENTELIVLIKRKYFLY